MTTHAEAESRVKLLFWIHLAVYFVAIAGMVFLNYTQTPDKKWALWVAFGWGAGIVLHGTLLYFSQTREKAIARTLVRMNRRSK